MKATLRTTAIIAAAFAISCAVLEVAVPAQAQQSNSADTPTHGMSMDVGGDMMMMRMLHEGSANHKWGMIANIQNNEQGRPEWIVAGH
jgi:hypothetical protein